MEQEEEEGAVTIRDDHFAPFEGGEVSISRVLVLTFLINVIEEKTL